MKSVLKALDDKMRNSTAPDLSYLSTHSGISFTSISSCGQGCGVRFYALESKNGNRYFLKFNSSGEAKPELEGWMLEQLAEAGMPIPGIAFVDEKHLLMAHVEGSTYLPQEAEIDAAKLLAKLHSHTAASFGLDRPTLIGALEQPNTPSASWAVFFRDQRILYSTEKAYQEGHLDTSMRNRLENLATNIEDYLTGEETPSLVHGDMWGGNLIADSEKIRAFIDPAIYYSDHETELAFATLFGTFSKIFFEAYNQISPIRPGFFETRQYLYNVYPLLVHVRLFGASYLPRLDSCLKALGV